MIHRWINHLVLSLPIVKRAQANTQAEYDAALQSIQSELDIEMHPISRPRRSLVRMRGRFHPERARRHRHPVRHVRLGQTVPTTRYAPAS